MKNNILIQFSSNYADEFDVEGFIVLPEKEWEAHKAAVALRFEEQEEIEIYFGTNESMIYESLDSYLCCFRTTVLSDEEHAVLQKLFNPPHQHAIGPISNGMVVMIDT